jgi:hypothetical protein
MWKRRKVMFKKAKRRRRIFALPNRFAIHPERSLPEAIPAEKSESPKPARKMGRDRASLRKETSQ